jgi:hypothetical protein
VHPVKPQHRRDRGFGVSLCHPRFSRLYIVHWMTISLDPHQFSHHDTILTREKNYMEELLCGIYKNSVINGLGLLFTAIIQTVQGKLDLYHAIVVTHILFFFDFIFPCGMYLRPFNHHSQELTGKKAAERRFIWSRRTNFQMFIYLLMHAFGVIVIFIWILYSAIDGSKFGSQPSCNDRVKIVFFFVPVKATVTWLRVMMIVFFAVTIPLSLSI